MSSAGSLSDIAKEISNGSYLEFKIDRLLAEQRVSIFIQQKNRNEIMRLLVDVLNHDNNSVKGYDWQRFEDEKTHKITYTLKKLKRAFIEEERELDFPKTKTVELLKESRDVLSGITTSRARLAIDKNSYEGKALVGITDNQIENLVNGEMISLKDKIDPEAVRKYHEDWVSDFKKNNKDAPVPEKGPYEYPVLRLIKGERGSFVLSVFGANTKNVTTGVLIDPFRYSDKESPLYGEMTESIKKIDDDRIIDLSPYLDAKNVSDDMRSDIGFILKCLHEASGINIAHEAFIYNEILGNFQGGILKIRKGKLRAIFHEIWKNFGYNTRQENGVFYLWSPSWAFNRVCDVSDVDINYLKGLHNAHVGFSVNDWMDIGSRLNKYQMKYTLRRAIKMGAMEGGGVGANSLEVISFTGMLPNKMKENLLAGKSIWWQDIPADIRMKLNPNSMSELDTSRPPLSYNSFMLLQARGELSLKRQVIGSQAVENVILNLQDASGKFLFWGGFSGIYTAQPSEQKTDRRALPKRR